MSAADLPLGTIIANGPRVMVKLKSGWCEAMQKDLARNPQPDEDADWCLANGWTIVRRGLGD